MKKKNRLLCRIFDGCFRLHHFLSDKVRMGILYLLTGGTFGADSKDTKSSKDIEENKVLCLNCGRYVKSSASFCPNCGNPPKVQIVFTYASHIKKEKSLYQKNRTKNFYDDYIVFDLETTGFDPISDKIIEIGALKYKNNVLMEKFNMLINPEIKLPKNIIELTGITDNMLTNCKTINDVLPKFIDFIEDYTLIAHNASFDIGFIEQNIKKLNINMIKNKNFDTLYSAREFISTENHKLETLKNTLNYLVIRTGPSMIALLQIMCINIARKDLKKKRRSIHKKDLKLDNDK